MTLKIGIIGTMPSVSPCALDRDCPGRGYAVDAALAVCESLRLDCKFEFYPSEIYGDVDENGTGTGMIGAIQEGRFDTAIPVFSPTLNRIRSIAFSDVYFYFDTLLVTRAPDDELGVNWSVISAFQWPTWFCFGLGMVLMSFLITGIFRRLSRFLELKTSFYFLDFLEICNWLMTQEVYKKALFKFHSIRLLIVFWSLAGVVLTSAYTGMLFTKAVIRSDDPPFTDTESFVSCLEKRRCRLIGFTESISFLQQLTADESRLGRRMKKALLDNPMLLASPDRIADTILKEKQIYLTWITDKHKFYYFTKGNFNCSYYTIDPSVKDVCAFPVRKNSSILLDLNRLSTPFRENGLADALLNFKYPPTSSRCREPRTGALKTNFQKEASAFRGVSVIFYFYVIGVSISFFVFAVEEILARLQEAFIFIVFTRHCRLEV